MQPDFAGSGAKELSYLLSSVVTPFLKGYGYQKVSHTYRKAASSGNQVTIQFRGRASTRWCEFHLVAAALSEPEWDAANFGSGRQLPSRPPREGDPSVFWWRIGAPGSPPTHAKPWSYGNIEERRELGVILRNTLYADVIPYLDMWLDHDSLLARTPPPDADWRRLDGFGVSDRLRLALLAANGPSDQLREMMTAMDRDPSNERLLRWAAIRAVSGPTWADPT